jgi:hypothetical protein
MVTEIFRLDNLKSEVDGGACCSLILQFLSFTLHILSMSSPSVYKTLRKDVSIRDSAVGTATRLRARWSWVRIPVRASDLSPKLPDVF